MTKYCKILLTFLLLPCVFLSGCRLESSDAQTEEREPTAQEYGETLTESVMSGLAQKDVDALEALFCPRSDRDARFGTRIIRITGWNRRRYRFLFQAGEYRRSYVEIRGNT